jgi:uncharacterized RDD family membrane protein YckC
MAAYLAVLTFVSARLIPPDVRESLFAGPTVGQLSAFLVVTLPVILYFSLMESSSFRGTLGKRALGIAVVTEDLTRLSRSRALGRAALKFLPWELSHGCLWRIPGWPASPHDPPLGVYVGFGVVWALIIVYILGAVMSDRRQTLYDRLCRCVVIR